MSQRGRMAVFIGIVTSVWTMLHAYVGERILGQEPLPVVWRALGWAGLLLLAAGPVLAFTAGRSPRLPARRVIEVAGFTAMGLSSLLIVFAFAGDVLRLRAWLGAGASTLAGVGGALLALGPGPSVMRSPETLRH